MQFKVSTNGLLLSLILVVVDVSWAKPVNNKGVSGQICSRLRDFFPFVACSTPPTPSVDLANVSSEETPGENETRASTTAQARDRIRRDSRCIVLNKTKTFRPSGCEPKTHTFGACSGRCNSEMRMKISRKFSAELTFFYHRECCKPTRTELHKVEFSCDETVRYVDL